MTTTQQIAILKVQFASIAKEESNRNIRVHKMLDAVQKMFGRIDKSLLIALSACTGFLLWESFEDMHVYINKFCPDITTTGLIDPTAQDIYIPGIIAEIETGVV